jgi:hypothetical protein
MPTTCSWLSNVKRDEPYHWRHAEFDEANDAERQ